jgi:uncharacterized membrane protein YdjX (TVP38/TMEM64 family)
MRRRRALTVVALAGLVVLLWSAWELDAVMAWLHHARPVPFFAAMAVLTSLGAPPTPFLVVAGASFGVGVGLAGSLLATAVSLWVNYAVARGGLRPRVEALLRRFGQGLPSLGEAQGRARAVRFTLLVKLAPGPVLLKNYLLAVAGVPFAPYFAVSMLVSGAYAVALVVLGDSVLDHQLERALPAALVLATAAALGLWWRQRRRAGLERASAGLPPENEGEPLEDPVRRVG